MNTPQWKILQEIVATACELTPGERDQYLQNSCKDDPDLYRQAAEMIAVYDQTDVSFAAAGGAIAARALAGPDIQVGSRIGPYRVTGMIGHGGMGTVYRAQRADDQFRQDVAIKVMRSAFGNSQEAFSRFRSERQILANISHPNIAHLIDGGVTPAGLPYLVMEYIEGLHLDRYAKQNTLSTEARLILFRELCSAVQHAHQNLIVHRDLKPANVIVGTDGTPKLLDFGIAKLLSPELSADTMILTRPAERLMTPEYASPEQIRGENITTATDIYGLGVLLYELLTEVRPFQIANLSPAEIERLICEVAPTPPSTVNLVASTRLLRSRSSSDLDRIVLKALHKIPSRRYASASDLSADIERYLTGFPVMARPDSLRYRTSRFIGRNRLAVAASALFLLTVVGLSIGLGVQARRAHHEAQSADAVSTFLVGLFKNARPDETKGRVVTARDILDQGSRRLDKDWKGQPTVKARLLTTLGTVYQELGENEKAASLLKQAEALYAASPGSDPLEVAETEEILGTTLVEQGDLANAQQHYIRSLHIYEKQKGKDSAEAAELLSSIGGVRHAAGDIAGAEVDLRRAIEIDTRLLGPEAEETLEASHNLESIYGNTGRYREAEVLIRKVLTADRRIYGEYQIRTAADMNNLAYLLDKLGRLSEEKPILDETLAIRMKLLGPEHPHIALSLMLLGWWNREMGNFEQARSLTESALAISRKTQGPDSAGTAFDEDALGLVYLDIGDLARAKSHMEAGLKSRLPPNSTAPMWIGQSYDHLGLVDLAQGNLPAACANLLHALDIRKKAFTTEDDSFAESYNHLGWLEQKSSNPAAALQSFQNALRIAKKMFGDSPHPITAEALHGIGVAQLALNQSAEAESALTASLQMQNQLYPPTQPNLLATQQALQQIQTRQSAANLTHTATPR